MHQRFTQEERLKSRKLIGELFREGKSVKAFPVMAVLKPVTLADAKVKAGFSVSKRKFKKATDRNLMRRRMLEAYRLHKAEFLQGLRLNYAIMFIYVSKEKQGYEQIEQAVVKCLEKIKTKEPV